MKNKRAMAAAVAVLILILIVFAGTAILWNALNNSVNKGLEKSKSCYDLINKVSFNTEHTCYDAIHDEMHISIEVKDIELDGLFLVVANEDSAQSFELTKELTTIPNLLNYTRSNQVKFPDKNSGSTYIATGITTSPLSVGFVPKLNGNLCEGETLTDIGPCA